MQVALRRALDLCQPQDVLITFVSGLSFINSTTCALVTSKLSRDYEQPDLAREAAEYAVKCALAEPYDSTDQLIETLEGLQDKFQLLQFPDLSQRAAYYKFEINSPVLRSMPRQNPNLFEIYWADLEGTQGCEIYKTRPCIVVSNPSTYKSQRIVTVIPLSTKSRGGIASIPFYLRTKEEDNCFQEARLDQARSVDVTRLLDLFGNLPPLYQSQLKLAYRNYIGSY